MQSPSPQGAGPPPSRSRGIALARRLLGPIWFRVGFTAVLEVPGRRSGTPRRATVFPFEVDETLYLLSQYGESEWVRNLRAAGRGTLRHKGQTVAFAAAEVDGAERERVIAAFRARTPKPFSKDFDQLPDAADHPTFRVQPIV